MDVHHRLREQLCSAMAGAPTAIAAADRLCEACVRLLASVTNERATSPSRTCFIAPSPPRRPTLRRPSRLRAG